jgi:hypothetical protein
MPWLEPYAVVALTAIRAEVANEPSPRAVATRATRDSR